MMKIQNYLLFLLGIFGGITLGGIVGAYAQNATLPIEQVIGNTITGLAAAVTAGISLILIILKWIDSWLSKQKDSAFKRKATEVIGKAKNSLEETDKWVRDTITAHTDDMKLFLSMIGKYPTIQQAYESKEVQNFIKNLDARSQEAKAEFDRWYGFASTVSGLNNKDPNIAKLAEIETVLTPAGSSPQTTTTTTTADTASNDAVPS